MIQPTKKERKAKDLPVFAQPQETSDAHKVDPIKLANLKNRMKDEQNLIGGVLAAGVAAFIGAVLWAVITLAIDYQIGWMAVGVGFLVGFANRYFGRGVDQVFGVAGALMALLGCLSGNVLTMAVLVSQMEAVPLLDVLSFFALTPAVVIEILGLTFSPIDLLFYALAAYEGYKFSFRSISKAEMEALVVVKPQYP